MKNKFLVFVVLSPILVLNACEEPKPVVSHPEHQPAPSAAAEHSQDSQASNMNTNRTNSSYRIKENAVLRIDNYNIGGWTIVSEDLPSGKKDYRMRVSIWKEGDSEDQTKDLVIRIGDKLHIGDQVFSVTEIDKEGRSATISN